MSEEARPVREVLEALVAEFTKGKDLAEQDLAAAFGDAATRLVEVIRTDMLKREAEQVQSLRSSESGFRDRNYQRWKPGFDMLAVLRQTSVEAGQMFQAEFLSHPGFVNDPLLGVLMRLHVHACRVMGELEALLVAGYADGALARWRALHEIAVFAILIRRHGQAAAEDFIRYGLIEAVNGMERYQETAVNMGREPYSHEELATAFELRDNLLAQCDAGIRSTNGWARAYVGSSKFPKLQKAAGLERWASDYKAASRNIHFDYREMGSLLVRVRRSHVGGRLTGDSDLVLSPREPAPRPRPRA